MVSVRGSNLIILVMA